MDNLVGHFIPEQSGDLSRTLPGHLQHVGGGVVDQSAPELDAVGIEQANAIAAAEVSMLAAKASEQAAPKCPRCGGSLSCPRCKGLDSLEGLTQRNVSRHKAGELD